MIYDYLFKFIIIGDTNIGKSCITRRFVENKFNLVHDLTIGVEFGSKIIKINDKNIKIQIWDTAGQETFRSITRTYYKGCAAVLLVYDVTNKESFKNLTYWLQEIKENIEPYTKIILIGNKCDLDASSIFTKRVISIEEGQTFANQYNLDYIETSAKTGKNINKAFEVVTQDLLNIISEETNLDIFPGIKKGFDIDATLKSKNKFSCCSIT